LAAARKTFGTTMPFAIIPRQCEKSGLGAAITLAAAVGLRDPLASMSDYTAALRQCQNCTLKASLTLID
jgi:hypothetical protein